MTENDRTLRKYGDSLGQVDKQIRALGTTLRYSVAGAAIFGGYQGVQNLNQIQQQLGLISAISPTAFGGVALTGDALTKFGEQAEDAAYRALTPSRNSTRVLSTWSRRFRTFLKTKWFRS